MLHGLLVSRGSLLGEQATARAMGALEDGGRGGVVRCWMIFSNSITKTRKAESPKTRRWVWHAAMTTTEDAEDTEGDWTIRAQAVCRGRTERAVSSTHIPSSAPSGLLTWNIV